jgi:hypothetical protein
MGLSIPSTFDIPPTYEHTTVGPGRLGGGTSREYINLVTLYAKKAERNTMMVLDLLRGSMGINSPNVVGGGRKKGTVRAGVSGSLG